VFADKLHDRDMAPESESSMPRNKYVTPYLVQKSHSKQYRTSHETNLSPRCPLHETILKHCCDILLALDREPL
jgi:hypothetical protein